MNNIKPNILIVDNYDSFTFNLVQIIREYGKCDFKVKKNDEINITDAGLYHSWGIYIDGNTQYPDSNLRITALSDDGIIMGISNIRFNIRGVQFHPESFISEYGHLFVQNWINNLLCK